MWMSRFSRLLSALALLAGWTPCLHAQFELRQGPPLIESSGFDPDLAQPFLDPFAFDPDYQFFAPAEVDALGGEIDPSIGWFATYDRTYLYTSRPKDEASYTQGDFTWGNRFDIGYMTEERHGWLFSFLHVDGPNAVNILEMERINVFNTADLQNPPAGSGAVSFRGGAAGGGGNQNPQSVPGFPARDRNNPITNARDYLLRDSLNNAKVGSFEVNKTFRVDPLHYGSTLEPFLGFRYTNVDDFFENDLYQRFDNTGLLVFTTGNTTTFPLPPFTTHTTEQLTSLRTRFANYMFGGQLGLRWFKQKAKWNLSGEVRAFALQNFQSFTRQTDIERTTYTTGVATTAAAINAVYYARALDSGHSSEFVFGTEIRGEAAYSITKYMQLRVGVQFMDFARGIGRGNDLSRNDQDFMLVGATGGIAINR